MSGWILETLVATTLLMVIVLLVRQRVAATFGPRIAYLLWLLPALRMVLPPLPETLIQPPLEQIPVLIEIVSFDGPAEAVGAAVAPADGALPTLFDGLAALPWGAILLSVWLGGALLHFGWHLLAYRRFVRQTLARSTPLPRLDRDGIEVCASGAVDGPFAAGVFVKTIVLPFDWRWRYSEEELRLALRHEFIHHLRWDLSANFAALAMLSLHWFNPVAHRAWRAFRADQELACDALVLADATPSERHSYGLAVVKSACSRTPVAACTLGNHDELKRRLRMMKSGRTSVRRTVSGIALAAALVGGGLALTASGGVAAEAATEAVAPIKAAWIEPAPPVPPVLPEVAEPMAMPAAVVASAPAPPPLPAPAALPILVAPRAPGAPAAPPVPPAPPAGAASWYDPEAAESAAEAAETAAAAAEEAAERAAAVAEARAEREAERAERAQRAGERHRRVVVIGSDEAGRRAAGAHKCRGGGKVVETDVDVDDRAQRSHVIVCAAGPDEKEIRRITIQALEKARSSLAASRELQRDHLQKALAGLDAELARLRAEPR